jgi:hypothetical protein
MDDQQLLRTMVFPLRLAKSIKEAATLIALEDGTSLNQFIVSAMAEKISRSHDQMRRARGASGPDVDGKFEP